MAVIRLTDDGFVEDTHKTPDKKPNILNMVYVIGRCIGSREPP